MMNQAAPFHRVALVLIYWITSSATCDADGAREVQDATSAAIQQFIDDRQMTVLTFTGYSGAEYEDPETMLEHASRNLDKHDPTKTLVNIGATEAGIGAVYELAKQKGFTTMGIVSTLAREEGVTVSKHVDFVFYVKDSQWGGNKLGTDQLSPTSATIVECSQSFVAIGGGDVTRDEMLAARKAGKLVTFVPADMNHKIAREKARKKGHPEPTSFRGTAHEALAKDK